VPGPVDSPASAGTNSLLRRGAILCRSADDVLEELKANAPIGLPAGLPLFPAEPPPGLNETERRLWDLLSGQPAHVDDLTRQMEMSIAELSRMLMMLEMRRVVRRLPGNRYERC
jgi:DNA processing protein